MRHGQICEGLGKGQDPGGKPIRRLDQVQGGSYNSLDRVVPRREEAEQTRDLAG